MDARCNTKDAAEQGDYNTNAPRPNRPVAMVKPTGTKTRERGTSGALSTPFLVHGAQAD